MPLIRKFKTAPLVLGAFLAMGTAPAQAQLRIMAVGDSITEGFTPDRTGTASYRKEFEAVLNQTGCDFEMVGSRSRNYFADPFAFGGRHEGYSAHRADNILNGLDANPGIDAMMATNSPDAVLLHIGSNDMRIGQNPLLTSSEIEQITTRILNANGNARIFVANVIPWFGASTPNNPDVPTSVSALGSRITASVNAMGNPNVILVDVRSGFTPSLMQSDLIHPNADGEAHIADAFAAAVENSGICAQFDATPPATFINIPTVGGTVGASATYSGTATDSGGSGFNRVNIAVQRNSDNSWLNFNTGGFGPISINGVDVGITTANLTNTSLTSTNWNINVNLPAAGSYRLYALAVDNAGNDAFHGTGLAVWPVNRAYNVASPDAVVPSAQTTNPANAATINPAVRAVTGTASDNSSGVARVRVRLQRSIGTSIEYWNGSAWIATSTFTDAALSDNGNTWSLPSVDLTQTGTYRTLIVATDNAGNTSFGGANPQTTFTVEIPDSTPPVAEATRPADGSTVRSNAARDVTGTVSDDISGVARVRVRIQTIGQSPVMYWNGSAWTTTSTFPDANVSANGRSWRLPAVDLSNAGNYRVLIVATDISGNVSRGGMNPQTNFSVLP